ncbi:MAG: hypothetical protein HQM11_01055 [SAR324 cluster bacterium]|nr:hypothetical protein [SAR324 cluster bacterium]
MSSNYLSVRYHTLSGSIIDMSKNPKKRNKPKKNKNHLPRSVMFRKRKSLQTLQFSNYSITYDALERTRFPEEVEEQFKELHDLVYSDPLEAIPRLKALKAKYPEIRELYNWLFAALSKNEQLEEADAIVKENYQKHPDYLFAKLNYAEFCLRKGNFEEVPIILEQKFDLKMLYPDRDIFHITEVVGFFGVTGLYFLESGQIEAAKTCFNLLQDIAPDSSVTSKLMLKLAPFLFRELLGF